MIVLDTHIWIWWVDDNPRLSHEHAALIASDRRRGLGISSISCWEIALLCSRGRLSFNRPVLEWLESALAIPDVNLIPITPSIAVDSVNLPGEFHKDPADRLIVATARRYDCALLTQDVSILAYPHVKLLP